MNCPSCNSRIVGRVGTEQYYCWECCVEFNTAGGTIRIFQVDLEGELVSSAAGEPPALSAGASLAVHHQ